MTAGGLEVFRGAAGVDLDRVERELRGLWKQAAERVAEEGRPPVTRVATVNLVVLARGAAEAERAAEAAIELSARHPGRLLVIAATDGAAALTASISAHCHLTAGERQVCSEQVLLEARGTEMRRVAAVVTPLLIPDLPAILWLPGDPTALPVADELLAVADRIVVDAHRFPDAITALARLVAWSERGEEITDLAWLRLERWRSLVAQLFDDPAARADLERLEQVEVEYLTGPGDAPEGRVEALYFLAWVATRLGCRWREAVRGGGTGRFAVRREDGRRLDLVLRHRPREGTAPGDLARVRLCTAAPECSYEIARLPGREVAELRVRGPRDGPLPSRIGLASPGLVDLVCRALETRGSDRVYREALALARAFAGAGPAT